MKIFVENIDKWILVTGMIRSGTTFAGKILSAPLQVDYIHEPFNNGYTIPEGEPFPPRYVSPDAREATAYHEKLDHIFRYDFRLATSWDHRDPWWRKMIKWGVGSRGPFYLRLAKLNPLHRAAIIKDPLAKRPAEYLYHHFGVRPVVIVRHPTSLAASLKRVGWWPGVEDFKQSPDLIQEYLASDSEWLNRTYSSRFLESMAHWRLTYRMLLSQVRRYSDWIVVTHEKLSAQPLSAFRRLFDELGLPWSSRVTQVVSRLTGHSNPTEARHNQAMDLKRNSAEIFEKRRDSLTREERRAIFEIVGDVALQIYSKESFALDR